MKQNRRTVELCWTSFIVAPLTLAAAAIAVPYLLRVSPTLALALQRGFALVCHQQPERSFVLFGGSVAVCARCLGIYLGAALGLLLRAPRTIAGRLFVTAVSGSLIDWIAEAAGLHGNWMLARFALGAALGIAAAMLVYASAVEVQISSQAEAA